MDGTALHSEGAGAMAGGGARTIRAELHRPPRLRWSELGSTGGQAHHSSRCRDSFSRLSSDISEVLNVCRASESASLAQLTSALHQVFSSMAMCETHGCAAEQIRRAVVPLRAVVSASPFFRRAQQWPRGYPGDFETVELMCTAHNKETQGTTAWLLEEFALTSLITQQHRNKVRRQSELIYNTLAAGAHARVLSIACGPSADLRAVCGDTLPAQEQVVLNDADSDALAFSLHQLGPVAPRCKVVAGNVFRSIQRLQQCGPFDLILAGGLFDYLPERHAVSLVGSVTRRLLRRGGTFFFTNIAAGNPYRPCMEYLTNWPLIERTADDLQRLVSASCSSGRLQLERDSTRLTFPAELR